MVEGIGGTPNPAYTSNYRSEESDKANLELLETTLFKLIEDPPIDDRYKPRYEIEAKECIDEATSFCDEIAPYYLNKDYLNKDYLNKDYRNEDMASLIENVRDLIKQLNQKL